MYIARKLLIFLLLLLVPSITQGAAPTTKLRAAYPTLTPSYAVAWMTEEIRSSEKHGIDVELLFIQSSPSLVAANAYGLFFELRNGLYSRCENNVPRGPAAEIVNDQNIGALIRRQYRAVGGLSYDVEAATDERHHLLVARGKVELHSLFGKKTFSWAT
jgi:hypothetical protein